LEQLASTMARGELRVRGGEPLLHPDLDDVLAAAARAGHRVMLETNGLGLGTAARARALRAAGLHGVSIMVATLDGARHRSLISENSSPRDALRAMALSLRAGFELEARLPIADGLAPAVGRLGGLSEAFPELRRFALIVPAPQEADAVEIADALALAKELGHATLLGGPTSLGGPWPVRWNPRGRRRFWLEADHDTVTDAWLEWARGCGLAGVTVDVAEPTAELDETVGAIARAELEFEVRVALEGATSTEALSRLLRQVAVVAAAETQVSSTPGQPTAWADLDAAWEDTPRVRFDARRSIEAGFPPPCALPSRWRSRPQMWRGVLSRRDRANAATDACRGCALADQCAWNDLRSLTPAQRDGLRPIEGATVPWDDTPQTRTRPPRTSSVDDDRPPVICTTPWTTMEVVDPDGLVRQCCSTWTVGSRGNLHDTPSLMDVWNGGGYRAARAAMAGDDEHRRGLCHPVCSRLHDHKYSEREFQIWPGSKRFVDNQLQLAEDIAARRTETRGKPLYLAICPSTYCNYDCIMCNHGRSPRRDLPPSIWEEVHELLPTLRSLTLLGGEPLASNEVMSFLREFDVAEFPDVRIDLITNGSLLTAKALRHLTRCSLGGVTLSLNAGTPEVYQAIQRGQPLSRVLDNLDALLRFRAQHHRWFGITLSFVVQPKSASTLIQFGELAALRGVEIRLMALSAELASDLDFYLDADTVARCVEHVDRFITRFETRPNWVREARAVRSALLEEAAARMAGAAPRDAAEIVRLPVL
jgi:molybdenum cofactor biosynthesis enzyme MoaA